MAAKDGVKFLVHECRGTRLALLAQVAVAGAKGPCAKVVQALRDLGITQTLSSDELVAHTQAVLAAAGGFESAELIARDRAERDAADRRPV